MNFGTHASYFYEASPNRDLLKCESMVVGFSNCATSNPRRPGIIVRFNISVFLMSARRRWMESEMTHVRTKTKRGMGGRKGAHRLTGDNLARMDSSAHEPLYAPARSQFQRKLNLRTKFLSVPFPPLLWARIKKMKVYMRDATTRDLGPMGRDLQGPLSVEYGNTYFICRSAASWVLFWMV